MMGTTKSDCRKVQAHLDSTAYQESQYIKEWMNEVQSRDRKCRSQTQKFRTERKQSVPLDKPTAI